MLKLHCLPRIVLGVLLLVGLAGVGYAQQPIAVLTQVSGSATVYRTGTEVEAELDMVLRQGDAIQTHANSSATLTLSEGSTVLLKQNTRVNLDVLLQVPETGARQSNIKLLYGRIRAFLSPGHQKKLSTFDMETPNAQVGVKFSQPAVEVSYEPELKMTVVRTYTVCVSVVNLVTDAEIQRLCPGHQAIVKDDMILVTKLLETAEALDDVQRLLTEFGKANEDWNTEDNKTLQRDDVKENVEQDMELLVETVAGNGVTSGVFPATNQSPNPGIRPKVPQVGAGSFGFTFTITEE